MRAVSDVPKNSSVNYKDIAFKGLWTGVAAGLGYLIAALADVPKEWAVATTILANIALAWVRQRIGVTPPSLPSIKELRG